MILRIDLIEFGHKNHAGRAQRAQAYKMKAVRRPHVTWGTPVQSFVFLGLLVFELEPMYMYATSDRQTDADDRLMPPPLRGIINDLKGRLRSLHSTHNILPDIHCDCLSLPLSLSLSGTVSEMPLLV